MLQARHLLLSLLQVPLRPHQLARLGTPLLLQPAQFEGQLVTLPAGLAQTVCQVILGRCKSGRVAFQALVVFQLCREVLLCFFQLSRDVF